MASTKTVALITGCSKGGCGFAIAQEFAAKGCVVYATSRRLESMDELKHENIHKFPLDVTKDESVKEVVRAVIEKEGQIDVLYNNAGMSGTAPLIDYSMEEIMQTYDTNVYGILRMCKAVIPHMAARKKGTIVNVGSVTAHIPIPWSGPYCSSKAAVHSITETLQMECTPLKINVMLLAPGGVRSNIVSNQLKRIHIPDDSLWSAYKGPIVKKLELVQENKPTPTDVFARQVVKAVLQPHPPRYLTLAKTSGLYKLLQWLPRGLVLAFLWKKIGENKI
ncbi:NAD-P-binding protein [Daedaleopsis nitida]|nr:NAD-P-binding protein [Daedaleopsis nitida]